MKYVALAFVLSLVILQISAQVGAAYIPGMGSIGSVGRAGAAAGASAGIGNQGRGAGLLRFFTLILENLMKNNQQAQPKQDNFGAQLQNLLKKKMILEMIN
uniref:Uncharacterized shell protein 7 n=1 Tax=Margaritifera margaritifera TaxID=102329 RepID=USP7_PINMG|nr:RecName: Full=Uncharacterized shell protein 7; AltName: Full=Nacre uncharacterized shell protein 3; Short=NUSP3; Flags: Precursor [Pinctada margaritifera]CCE46177.1 nacre uncharacterized shell protein 3 [Pinctada margaritifera]